MSDDVHTREGMIDELVHEILINTIALKNLMRDELEHQGIGYLIRR